MKKRTGKERILFVSQESTPLGSTISLVSLIEGLREVAPGLKFCVLLPKKTLGKSKAQELLERHHIPYTQMLYRMDCYLPSDYIVWRQAASELANLFTSIYLSFYLRFKKISIVCSNSTAVDVGARAARLARVTHVYYIREIMKEGNGMEYRRPGRMKQLLEASDKVIFISRAVERKYKVRYRLPRSRQFYDGFMTEEYFLPNHEILANSKLVFLQAGRFGEEKGTLDSIDLMASLEKNGYTNWELRFFGDGSPRYVEKMKKKIQACGLSHKIFVHPYSDCIREEMGQADIVLMNSRCEGLGRVTIEGMLAGCLILGRGNAGTEELLQEDEHGVTYRDKESFIRAVLSVSRDRERYRQIAARGQEWAKIHFDRRQNAKCFCEYLGLG